MSHHNVIHSQADYDKALKTEGKYVLVHAHTGSIHEKSEEYAAKYKNTCDSYSVNVAEEPKLMEYFGIKETPAAILYKDGKEVKKVEGKNEGGMQDMATLLA